MDREQKTNAIFLAVIGVVYFAIFFLPNLTGAKDVNMLALFEVDEYAQYPHLINMLTPGATFYQSVRNFFVYLHYFYGYPFYFFSAITALPLKLLGGADWVNHTQWIVAWLRQAINVLPMLISLGLLVYLQTRFRSLIRSAGLFLLLLCLPAVIVNNLWWHPDSLAVFFVVLTFFFLDRDQFHFGWNFALSAAACGLAVGTKYLGLSFGLAIPVYLVWGVAAKHISWKQALQKGVLFVGVMIFAVVVSNPLLLLPQERAEIVATQKLQFIQTGTGIFFANKAPFLENGRLPLDFREHYGELFFLISGAVGLALGIMQKERRLFSVMILAWMIPLTLIILTAGTRRTHYFLPVMLPFFSALVNLFPSGGWFQTAESKIALFARRWLPIALGVLVLAQFILFVQKDIEIYAEQLNRERDSKSIAFYGSLNANVISKLPEDQPLVIFRDWRIYFPQKAGQRVEMSWDMANYAFIRELKPNLILLEEENLKLFSKPEIVENAVNPDRMQETHLFYMDAEKNQLEGYQRVFADSFGAAYLDDATYQFFIRK